MLEVLKQALDLVVESKHYAEECSHMATRNDCDHFDAVAENLRQAIAVLESQEPIYQYQLASGAWIDQTKESHDYNVRHGQATVRVLYTHPPQEQQSCDKRTEQEPMAWISQSGALYRTRFHAVGNAEQLLTPLYTHPKHTKVVFPTMLRKMWSGSEVQAWLDENVNKEKS